MPVYNTEDYLDTCIKSILSQTYQDIELILINDGSTDNSGKICDKYAKQDKRIKVIHQNNSGPSVARNRGIDVSAGEYIQFVDADDHIDYKMTETLVEALSKNSQLVICGYRTINLYKENIFAGEHRYHIEGRYQQNEFMLMFGKLLGEQFINPLWNKMYIRDIVENLNLRFINNLNMGEDLLFNLEYIKACDNFIILKDLLYNYIESSNSLTRNFKKGLFQNQQMLFKEIRKFLCEKNYMEENRDFIESSYTDSIVGCLQNIFHEDSSLFPRVIKEYIYKIVCDDCVRKNIIYFKAGNIQKRVIGLLIKQKSVDGIYLFFKVKTFLRDQTNPLFKVLKKINCK